MKAAYYSSYGDPDVVTIQEVTTPTPASDELLVRVVATVVTAADARIRAARFPKGFGIAAKLFFGARSPRNNILGSCFSGVIDAIGKDVRHFTIGDQVCGMTGTAMRAHAEYITIKQTATVVPKPHKVSHQDAAGMLFGGTTALYFLRDIAKVQPGETVLVNGASGAVGTNAVQIAKHLGAIVTGVTSTPNVALVSSIGASGVIDYKQQALGETNDTYDVVLDTVGNIHVKSGIRMLSKKGRLVLMVASFGEMLASSTNRKVLTGTAPERKDDIKILLDMMQSGHLKTIIDSTFTLDAIADAHRKVDTGSKVGNVIVSIDN